MARCWNLVKCRKEEKNVAQGKKCNFSWFNYAEKGQPTGHRAPRVTLCDPLGCGVPSLHPGPPWSPVWPTLLLPAGPSRPPGAPHPPLTRHKTQLKFEENYFVEPLSCIPEPHHMTQ